MLFLCFSRSLRQAAPKRPRAKKVRSAASLWYVRPFPFSHPAPPLSTEAVRTAEQLQQWAAWVQPMWRSIRAASLLERGLVLGGAGAGVGSAGAAGQAAGAHGGAKGAGTKRGRAGTHAAGAGTEDGDGAGAGAGGAAAGPGRGRGRRGAAGKSGDGDAAGAGGGGAVDDFSLPLWYKARPPTGSAALFNRQVAVYAHIPVLLMTWDVFVRFGPRFLDSNQVRRITNELNNTFNVISILLTHTLFFLCCVLLIFNIIVCLGVAGALLRL
mgnify:CR=1 FL=1